MLGILPPLRYAKDTMHPKTPTQETAAENTVEASGSIGRFAKNALHRVGQHLVKARLQRLQTNTDYMRGVLSGRDRPFTWDIPKGPRITFEGTKDYAYWKTATGSISNYTAREFTQRPDGSFVYTRSSYNDTDEYVTRSFDSRAPKEADMSLLTVARGLRQLADETSSS
jgi:hypothetical protein